MAICFPSGLKSMPRTHLSTATLKYDFRVGAAGFDSEESSSVLSLVSDEGWSSFVFSVVCSTRAESIDSLSTLKNSMVPLPFCLAIPQATKPFGWKETPHITPVALSFASKWHSICLVFQSTRIASGSCWPANELTTLLIPAQANRLPSG